jgi:hypothetical protein
MMAATEQVQCSGADRSTHVPFSAAARLHFECTYDHAVTVEGLFVRTVCMREFVRVRVCARVCDFTHMRTVSALCVYVHVFAVVLCAYVVCVYEHVCGIGLYVFVVCMGGRAFVRVLACVRACVSANSVLKVSAQTCLYMSIILHSKDPVAMVPGLACVGRVPLAENAAAVTAALATDDCATQLFKFQFNFWWIVMPFFVLVVCWSRISAAVDRSAKRVKLQ